MYSLCLSAEAEKALASLSALFETTCRCGDLSSPAGLIQTCLQLAGCGIVLESRLQNLDRTAPVFCLGPEAGAAQIVIGRRVFDGAQFCFGGFGCFLKTAQPDQC